MESVTRLRESELLSINVQGVFAIGSEHYLRVSDHSIIVLSIVFPEIISKGSDINKRGLKRKWGFTGFNSAINTVRMEWFLFFLNLYRFCERTWRVIFASTYAKPLFVSVSVLTGWLVVGEEVEELKMEEDWRLKKMKMIEMKIEGSEKNFLNLV